MSKLIEKSIKAKARLPFKIGDNAVYPAHGVGKVTGIESKEILGNTQTFYVLQILDSGMKIMVPTTNVTTVGLRNIISKREVERVYEILQEKQIVKIDHQTWNRRYREYMEKIKTGSLYEIAEVFRDLSLLKFTKELSFGERKLLDAAKNLLLTELALAECRDEEEIEEEINEIFASTQTKLI